MEILARRGTDLQRQFKGEKYCQSVIAWLNEKKDDAAHDRVRSLLRDAQVLTSNWVEVTNKHGESRFQYKGPRAEYKLARKRAHSLLRRYSYFPLLLFRENSLSAMWFPLKGPAGPWRWDFSHSRTNEMFVVTELVFGLGRGLLKVKECICRKWFFRKFSHQRFCSDRCRDKANKSLPQWKEYRRVKAREYYWLHKTKNIK